MKTRPLQLIAIASLIALPLWADEARIEGYKTQLRAVRPPELAREAARLTAGANADAADVVTAASAVNSPATHLVVGSVAKASPKSAGAAAAAAVASQPQLTSAIVKAAVSAAPSEVSTIVTESCKARPAMFYNIGLAAVTAEPSSSDKIIPAETEGVPALRPVIERAQKDFKKANRSASLALVLKHSENILVELSREQRITVEALLARETASTMATRLAAKADSAPVFGPPFVPGSPPSEVPAPGTVEQNPTNRNYSAP